MLQPNPKTVLPKTEGGSANKQRGQLRIALALLLVAFVALLVRDREFWFGPEETVESNSAAPVNSPQATAPAARPADSAASPARQPLVANNSVVPSVSTQPASRPAPAKRLSLPPLKVDVAAVEKHTVHHSHEVAKLEIPKESEHLSVVTASAPTLPTNAAERETLASMSSPVRESADATYPLLGPRMKVQGSVVLQAVIGADGIIENLQVVSGPSILTAAAQQAVRQWHFKPYLQNGQPVETQATITVNFSIRISDSNPAKIS